ncbi:hypothetical protein OG709_28150 [Streptomyces sp. NBC_01267]|uniref:hypothetical protein n=1 Tax=unclassified Streptomyces TaxID=2593676 RepID=UPI002B1CC6E7|nr:MULTISPECIES: hypothetical protein [unclassified Streptomyces]
MTNCPGPGPGPDTPRPAPAVGPAVAPAVGDTVHDPVRGRVGVVMGRVGPYLQLRPLGGGREWDADPDRVRTLSPAELLSARVALTNARSHTRIGL